ncbi:transposase [Streptomyces scabiei]|uniref:transposase n=1 Tax=Streptomyces scabiei TaxID=1930 RepID=UPI001E5E7F7B|nr:MULTISPECIES: transposase [Streptomyces]MDX2576999.1 transposase [Streptomyces scabiei]MDX2630182.1 transposase [Streptomyces scabiei]MDX2656745.1 transposase [Streptomyces scabiei]MDX2726279.1 transposase [Streptomyces scabiei]MDX2868217.1 transposase [Streptomyces scabiei]
MARFTKSQCRPCPARAQCTSTADSARTVGFPPRELRDLQLRVRAEQQTPEWKTRYAVRSGVEGTVNEFDHGHGMRRCRCRCRCRCRYRRTEQSPCPARSDGHRHQHRAPQWSPTNREGTPFPTTDRLPELPRPVPDLQAKILARPGHLTSATPITPSQESSS